MRHLDLTNAIIASNRAAALSVLEVLRFRRVEPLMVLGEIASTLVMMSRVAYYLKVTPNHAEISRATGVHEYRVSIIARALMPDLDASRARIARAIDLCASADAAMKSSYTKGFEQIEKMICSM